MTARVISLEGMRPARRYYYYELARYLYGLRGYVTVRDVCKVLFGVSLVSAAPFFCLFNLPDLMPCFVFTVAAAVSAVFGI